MWPRVTLSGDAVFARRSRLAPAYDGSVRASVPVELVRQAPDHVTMRDLAQPVVVVPPDALVLDVLEHAGPVASIVVANGSQVLGVVGVDELRGAEQPRDQVAV